MTEDSFNRELEEISRFDRQLVFHELIQGKTEVDWEQELFLANRRESTRRHSDQSVNSM